MSHQNQQFQHRWEFRRTENDIDSSSDDDHSRPSSASEPRLLKHMPVTCLFPEENVQQTVHSPTLPRGGKENHSCFEEPNREKGGKEIHSSFEELDREKGKKENHSSFDEPNRKLNKPGKTRERKVKSRTKKTTSNPEPSDVTLIDLRGYIESLVEGIKTAREDLLAWMSKELNSFSEGNIISAKPSETRKGQRQDAKRSKTPRNNPNKSRGRSGTKFQNREDGPSGRRSPQTNEGVVVLPKEGDQVVIEAKPVEKAEKQKGKTSRLTIKKRKVNGTEAAEQTDKTIAAAVNCVTFSTVLPQKQVINSERNPSEDGNGRDAVKKNALDSEVNLSYQHLNFDPMTQQKDGVFAQNGLRNVSDFEQNTCPATGNGNGNGFPFPLVPQGLSGEFGMPNISSQFGLPCLSQGNRMSGMYREPPRFPNGNLAFTESYGAFNQPLKFSVQQGGVVALQCPDIRRGTFNQGNITSQ